MFDVDGTLTQSNEVDAECSISAMKTAFNINHIDADWSKYKNVSDSGIFGEIFESHFHRKPESEDFDLIKINFLHELKAAIEKSNGIIAYCGLICQRCPIHLLFLESDKEKMRR
jgi:hypothetical protein